MHSKDPLASHRGICGLSIPLHEARRAGEIRPFFLWLSAISRQRFSFSSHSAATVPQALLVITAAELTTRLPVQQTATVLPEAFVPGVSVQLRARRPRPESEGSESSSSDLRLVPFVGNWEKEGVWRSLLFHHY